ncbi:MAG: sigma-70 family RNA polymerase sigma factor, partial [Planctomycetes bacterium]|nr:sigma-70 family RNA polymerase sigma factor [Planctomycetota bacterium]
ANEAWAGIVQSLRRSGPKNIPPQPPAYFARIARNKSLDAAKQADARAILALDGDRSDTEPAEEALAPDLMLESVEELERLQDCISRLSADEQNICGEIGLIMERKWKEVAPRLGLAESTLRSKWEAILDKLKRCLEKKI